MSLQAAAQHLASKGRGPDTHLVHMAPSEVAGLQALARAHGGTLTTNPHTGLPEAGFLSNLLPMVIGAGLAAATGGTSLALSPGMIGLGIGGLETLRTGSLSKGLMAGLGAYGGAGLGAGLGLGASEAAAAVTPQATTASELAATQAAQTQNAAAAMGIPSNAAAGVGNASFAPQLSANQIAGITPPVAGPASTTAFTAGAEPISRVATATPLPTTAPATSGFEKLAEMPTKDKLQYGLAALTPALMQQNQAKYQGSGPNPYEYTYDYKTGQYTRVPVGTRDQMPMNPTVPMMAGGGPVGEMSDRNEALTLMANGGQMYAAGGQINLQGTLNLSGGDSGGQFGQASPNGYQPMGSGGGFDPRAIAANPQGFQNYMAQMQQREAMMPGSTMLAQGMATGGGLGGMAQPRSGTYEQYLAGRSPLQQDVQLTREQFYGRGQAPQGIGSSFARGGGVSHLGDYSDGGRLLRGPGDGVSDSIPATIADKRPARLADGEFVVPARIVSELGNGSTEAGARKLYSMMDRIQKARSKTTGKDRMAVDSRADKALPA